MVYLSVVIKWYKWYEYMHMVVVAILVKFVKHLYLPTSHSLVPPFLTYVTSNNPPPSPGPNCVTRARSSFSFLLSAFRLDLSASVSKSSSNPLWALLALFSAFSSSSRVGEGVRRNRILGISIGSSYNPGDLFRGYFISTSTNERRVPYLFSTLFKDSEHVIPSDFWDIPISRHLA